MRIAELMRLDKESLAQHAQEGWDLANRRTAELARCKIGLEHVVKSYLVEEHRRYAVPNCPFCEAAKILGSQEYWFVKIRFIDQATGQPKVVTLRAEDTLGLTFLQIAALKLQAPIMETIPVSHECEQR
jgi:hypothetical protein